MIVDPAARTPARDEHELVETFAASRRGLLMPESRLRELPSLLSAALPAVSRVETWHPMRTAWWIVPFALLLGAEWWWRRRRGLGLGTRRRLPSSCTARQRQHAAPVRATSNQRVMYTRDQAKEIVDKVLNMATADAVEVNLTGGERSGTRWANSSITTNLVQYDRQVTVTVRLGQKSGTAETRDFSDAGLEDHGRRGALGSATGARQSEPARAARTAGVHPGRRGAAGSRELRAGRTRAHGEGLHRHRRAQRRARRRLHPEDRPGHVQREFEGIVRVLSRRRSGIRPHVPHG